MVLIAYLKCFEYIKFEKMMNSYNLIRWHQKAKLSYKSHISLINVDVTKDVMSASLDLEGVLY